MDSMLYRIKFILFISSCSLFFLSQITFAQEKWTVDPDELTSLGIKYERPELLEEKAGSNCFENNPLLQKMMQCGGNLLQSKDRRFLTFNMIGLFFIKITWKWL